MKHNNLTTETATTSTTEPSGSYIDDKYRKLEMKVNSLTLQNATNRDKFKNLTLRIAMLEEKGNKC